MFKFLQNKIVYFNSNMHKRKAQILKMKKSQPEQYKKLSQLKPFDFRSTQTQYPIKLTIREKYVYSPMKSIEKVKRHDFLSFDNKTGNGNFLIQEILLYLEKCDQLRSSELTNALVELSKKPNAQNFNWNEHEYILKSLEQIKIRLPQYNSQNVSQLCLALNRLNIKDENVWRALEVQCLKQKHNFTPFGYAQMLVSFVQNNYGEQSFVKEIIRDLPMKIYNMNPDQISNCFQALGDFVFEEHFLVLFWRRNKWFGAKNYPKIIRGLLSLNYDNHEEFWNEFLKQIPTMTEYLNEEITYEMLEAMQDLQQNYFIRFTKVNCEESVKFLIKHLVFCQTKLRAIENNKFFKIIQNDLLYYKEQQTSKQQSQEVQ